MIREIKAPTHPMASSICIQPSKVRLLSITSDGSEILFEGELIGRFSSLTYRFEGTFTPYTTRKRNWD